MQIDKKTFIAMVASGVIVFVIVAVAAIVFFFSGDIIKKVVETAGPRLTKAEVKLGKADINILTGTGQLEKLFIGNPQGFESDHAFSVNTIKVKVNTASITTDVITIDEIRILSPDIIYESTGGKSNFQAILDNVKQATGASGQSAEKPSDEAASGTEKNIRINDLYILDGRVKAALPMLGGKGLALTLPDIHMHDIGGGSGGEGASVAEVTQKIFTQLNSSIGKAVQNAAGSLGDLTKEGAEGIKKGAEGVGSTIKNLLDN